MCFVVDDIGRNTMLTRWNREYPHLKRTLHAHWGLNTSHFLHLDCYWRKVWSLGLIVWAVKGPGSRGVCRLFWPHFDSMCLPLNNNTHTHTMWWPVCLNCWWTLPSSSVQYPGDSVVTGQGRINGRLVYVFSQVSSKWRGHVLISVCVYVSA